MKNDVTIRTLLEAGVHFGHQVRYWNPKMAPYIFGARNKVYIINLEQTLPLYTEAVNFLGSVAAKKGKILFVGTKQQARGLLREEAERCGMPYVDYRWLGGMLTNYKTIRQSLKRLKELEALRDSSTFARISKKESLSITREITKLEKGLGGIRHMGGLPDALFIIDVGHEKIAVTEAAKLRIPIVGVVDTNNSPEGIDYVIPGNDDSTRAIKLYLQGIADAIVDARSKFTEEELASEKLESESPKKTVKKEYPRGRVFKKPSEAVASGDAKSGKRVSSKVGDKRVKVQHVVSEVQSVEDEAKVKKIPAGSLDSAKSE